MRRDYLFLATNLPPDQLVRDKHHFGVQFEADARESFLALGSRAPGLQAFLAEASRVPLFGIGIRNDFVDEQTATRQAWQTLSGIVDGYALFLDASPPKVCSYFILRDADSPDAGLRIYMSEGTWLSAYPKNPDSKKRWEDVRSKLSRRLLGLFDIAAAESQGTNPPLLHQLLYSIRMFRHGAESEIFGIQFLCKFSALEGLVCGPEMKNKHQLLTGRLGALFRGTPSLNVTQLKKLWELRCTASHQAKAFESEQDPDSVNHSPYIEILDRFFRAVLVYVLDNVDKAKTVDELWKHVASYTLPDYASAERPIDMPRFAASHFLINMHISLTGFGASFDTFYEPPDQPGRQTIDVSHQEKE